MDDRYGQKDASDFDLQMQLGNTGCRCSEKCLLLLGCECEVLRVVLSSAMAWVRRARLDCLGQMAAREAEKPDGRNHVRTWRPAGLVSLLMMVVIVVKWKVCRRNAKANDWLTVMMVMVDRDVSQRLMLSHTDGQSVAHKPLTVGCIQGWRGPLPLLFFAHLHEHAA